MIYVIGVDHARSQYPHEMNDPQKIEQLKKLINQLCDENKIKIIVEEWSDDARKYQSVSSTYSEDIAKNLGIEYLPCDANFSERKRLGLKSRGEIAQELGIDICSVKEGSTQEKTINDLARESDEKREKYWLEQIIKNSQIDKDTILVCGYGHADNFISLSKNSGFDAIRII